MRRLLKLVALLAPVLVPSAAFAQASIAGTVKDTSGAVVPGVTVEASSPELIEKVRSAVSDGTGRYRIENLRPGIYAVTIELTGSFTATVNADLRVGTVEETVTVSGETPVVDVQSAKRQQTITDEIIGAIPTARVYHSIMN